MATGKPWNEIEQQLIITAYLNMLNEELAGRKFNKAETRRTVLPLLAGRSAGSYEMKCCNISAALDSLGLKWIKGYKPLPGYQKSLKDEIARQLRSRPYLAHIAAN